MQYFAVVKDGGLFIPNIAHQFQQQFVQVELTLTEIPNETTHQAIMDALARTDFSEQYDVEQAIPIIQKI